MVDIIKEVTGISPPELGGGDGKGEGGGMIEMLVEALGNFFIRGSIFAMGAVMLTIGLIGLSKQD